MEDYLQNIRNDHPNLNPTETYKLLSKALLPGVAEDNVDFEDIADALELYEERLEDQFRKLRDFIPPESAEDVLKTEFRDWFADIESDHQNIDEILQEANNLVEYLPNEEGMQEMVDEKIQKDYPEFHKQYREHQQWLKTNNERLARQEQVSLEGEANQDRLMDDHTR